MNSTSTKFSLDAVDWQKIGKGCLIGLAGGALTYVPLFMGFSYVLDFGTHTVDLTPFVTVFLGVAANIVNKWVKDNTVQQ